jgi:hypothetical protein
MTGNWYDVWVVRRDEQYFELDYEVFTYIYYILKFDLIPKTQADLENIFRRQRAAGMKIDLKHKEVQVKLCLLGCFTNFSWLQIAPSFHFTKDTSLMDFLIYFKDAKDRLTKNSYSVELVEIVSVRERLEIIEFKRKIKVIEGIFNYDILRNPAPDFDPKRRLLSEPRRKLITNKNPRSHSISTHRSFSTMNEKKGSIKKGNNTK